jgi:hypothetical protein
MRRFDFMLEDLVTGTGARAAFAELMDFTFAPGVDEILIPAGIVSVSGLWRLITGSRSDAAAFSDSWGIDMLSPVSLGAGEESIEPELSLRWPESLLGLLLTCSGSDND